MSRLEADWEVEIGGDAPVIDACWTGFVDLRVHPEKVSEVSECHDLPGLADVLIRLNATNSPVWTCKTDVFALADVEPDELNASADEVGSVIACYIDLVPRSSDVWSDAARAEETCRQLCARLRTRPLRCCRVDVVIRRAIVEEAAALGTTVYATACGQTPLTAKQRLRECLAVFTEVVAGPR